MGRPKPLSGGEKWIAVLTLVFLLGMTGVYAHAARMGEDDGYIIRGGKLAQQIAPIEAVEWRVNINTATAEELTALPGVGKALAKRMVAYRVEHGRFRTAEELLEVKGIGESKLAGMKDWIILEEEAKR